MTREDFGDWARGLDELQFWQAVAMLGPHRCSGPGWSHRERDATPRSSLGESIYLRWKRGRNAPV
jgi:hypothetical protein